MPVPYPVLEGTVHLRRTGAGAGAPIAAASRRLSLLAIARSRRRRGLTDAAALMPGAMPGPRPGRWAVRPRTGPHHRAGPAPIRIRRAGAPPPRPARDPVRCPRYG